MSTRDANGKMGIVGSIVIAGAAANRKHRKSLGPITALGPTGSGAFPTECLRGRPARPDRKSFVAGNHIEQLFVDTVLAQPVKGSVERLQQVVDILIGALHGRETARIFARKGLRTGPEERNEKILANEGAQGRGVPADDFGQALVRPGNFGQTLRPGRVEGQ